MWDFSQLLEKWASAKVKGNHTINTLSMMQKECSAIITSTLRKFLLYLNLLRYLCYLTEMVSQSGQAFINYPNYDAKVIKHYYRKLIGWTYPEFKSPFNIHTINDVHILLEAFQCGKCYWVIILNVGNGVNYVGGLDDSSGNPSPEYALSSSNLEEENDSIDFNVDM